MLAVQRWPVVSRQHFPPVLELVGPLGMSYLAQISVELVRPTWFTYTFSVTAMKIISCRRFVKRSLRVVLSLLVKVLVGAVVLYALVRMIALAFDVDNWAIDRWHLYGPYLQIIFYSFLIHILYCALVLRAHHPVFCMFAF